MRERQTERDRDATSEWLHWAPSVCYALAEHNWALQAICWRETASSRGKARSAVCWSMAPLRRFHLPLEWEHFFCAGAPTACRYFLRSLPEIDLSNLILSECNNFTGRIYISILLHGAGVNLECCAGFKTLFYSPWWARLCSYSLEGVVFKFLCCCQGRLRFPFVQCDSNKATEDEPNPRNTRTKDKIILREALQHETARVFFSLLFPVFRNLENILFTFIDLTKKTRFCFYWPTKSCNLQNQLLVLYPSSRPSLILTGLYIYINWFLWVCVNTCCK